MHHEQDMRKMGGLWRLLPVTYAVMTIGTIAITGLGIPGVGGFAGFYSKDAIIEAAYAGHTPRDYAFWGLVIAAGMTAFYSWRLIFLTFHGSTRADHHTYDHAHESPWVMLIPLIVLAIGATFAGIVFEHWFIGEGYDSFWRGALFEASGKDIRHAAHEAPSWVSLAPTVAMLAGTVLAVIYYVLVPGLPALTARVFKPIYLLFLNKWYFDELYDFLFVRPAFAIGRLLWKGVDGAVIDGTIDGTAKGVLWGTGRIIRLQTGYVYHYAFAMLIGVAAILTYFILGGGGVTQ
jgi:NADH-quinone oxidoreductase subunit L